MVTFVMDQGNKINASLKAMKAIIASYMKLFPVRVESSKDGETSSKYSNLTPQDVVEIQKTAAKGGNQSVEEEDQIKDITALTAPLFLPLR
jgi:hypothetical protein